MDRESAGSQAEKFLGGGSLGNSRGVGLGPTTSAGATPALETLARITKTLQELNQVISQLEGSLEPVLRQPGPDSDVKSTNRPDVQAPLHGFVLQVESDLHCLGFRLHTLNQRIRL